MPTPRTEKQLHAVKDTPCFITDCTIFNFRRSAGLHHERLRSYRFLIQSLIHRTKLLCLKTNLVYCSYYCLANASRFHLFILEITGPFLAIKFFNPKLFNFLSETFRSSSSISCLVPFQIVFFAYRYLPTVFYMFWWFKTPVIHMKYFFAMFP